MGPFYPLSSGPDGGPDKGLKSRPEMPVLSGPFYPVAQNFSGGHMLLALRFHCLLFVFCNDSAENEEYKKRSFFVSLNNIRGRLHQHVSVQL